MPQKFERRALGRQERACRAVELGQDGPGLDIGAIAMFNPMPHVPEQLECEDRALETADAARVTCHDPSRGLRRTRDDRIRRDVASATEVRRQLASDQALVLELRQRRHGSRRPGGRHGYPVDW
jgi:hypothetical protein